MSTPAKQMKLQFKKETVDRKTPASSGLSSALSSSSLSSIFSPSQQDRPNASSAISASSSESVLSDKNLSHSLPNIHDNQNSDDQPFSVGSLAIATLRQKYQSQRHNTTPSAMSPDEQHAHSADGSYLAERVVSIKSN